MWAILQEYDEGEYDKYDAVLANTSEEHLKEKTNDISDVLDILMQDLSTTNKEELIRVQTYFAEQGILHMLLKLAELNYYKCTVLKDRAKELLGSAEFRLQAVQSIIRDEPTNENSAEKIAEEYLVDLNQKILRVVFLMIRYNSENCNIITRYDQLVYKIKETFQTEEYELR